MYTTKKALIIIIVIFLMNCQTNQTINYTKDDGIDIEKLTIPKINIESQVGTGEELFWSGSMKTTTLLNITDSFRVDGNFNRIYAGEYNLIGYNEKQLIFKTLYNGGLERKIIFDKDNPDYLYGLHGSPHKYYSNSIGSFNVINKEEINADIYQQTLIYNGIIDNVIKLEYREYYMDKIRDAYKVSLEYDISDSNIISYKGALFEISSANNIEIVYKVIKGFNE